MTIDPLSSGRTPAEWSRVQGTRDADAAARSGEQERSAGTTDQADVSDVARSIESNAGGAPPAIDGARLGQVLDRLNSGFYTEPHVLDTIASRIGLEPGAE